MAWRTWDHPIAFVEPRDRLSIARIGSLARRESPCDTAIGEAAITPPLLFQFVINPLLTMPHREAHRAFLMASRSTADALTNHPLDLPAPTATNLFSS